MTIRAVLKKGGNALLISVAVLIGLLITINLPLFDEDPLPEVAPLFEPVVLPPAEQNAYMAILGFSAASDRNMVAAGEQLLAHLDQLTPYEKLMGLPDSEDEKRILGDMNLDSEWISRLGHCSQEKENCLLVYSKRVNGIVDDTPRVKKILERFQILADMPDYVAPSDSLLLPQYSALLRLNDLQVAHAYNNRGVDGAIDALAQNLNFWRDHLINRDFLVGRMIAIAVIRNNLTLLSNLIELESISPDRSARLEHLLQPLTITELDMTETFLYEQRFSLQYTHTINYSELLQDETEWWKVATNFLAYYLLFQPNATQNAQYENVTKLASCLSQQTWQDYKLYQQSGVNTACNIENTEGQHNLWWLHAYNPFGEFMQSFISLETYTEYIARGHDLNGLLALTRLQLQLRTGKIASVEALLAKSESERYLPNPVQYNAETGKLFFDCLRQSASRECAVTLFNRE